MWRRKKKLVGEEVGEGYKEGGSHLPPLFLSLAPPTPSSPACAATTRRDDSYLSRSTAASPHLPARLRGRGPFLSLHLLPLITWKIFLPSAAIIYLFLFFVKGIGDVSPSRPRGAGLVSLLLLVARGGDWRVCPCGRGGRLASYARGLFRSMEEAWAGIFR